MRKILLLLITLFIGISCWGQWEKDCKFYIGTWQYKTDNEVFTMKTKFYEYDDESIGNIRRIVASFKYEKDGKIIFDDLNNINHISDDDAFIVIIVTQGLPLGKLPDMLGLSFVDPLLKKTSGWMSCVKVYSISPDKISWHLVEEEGTYLHYDMPPGGFTVPVDMILTKI